VQYDGFWGQGTEESKDGRRVQGGPPLGELEYVLDRKGRDNKEVGRG